MSFNLITILGPTATGKTKLAAELASVYNGEIISADSRQVYKGMDIGTGKDLADYKTSSGIIPYHLIDIISPTEEYNLYAFKKDFIESYKSIIDREKTPFLAGGTGLYLSSIIQNYRLQGITGQTGEYEQLSKLTDDELREILIKIKPGQHNTTDLVNRERIIRAIMVASSEHNNFPDTSFINSLIIGVNPERDEVKKRITARLKTRLQNGMIDEVKFLIDRGITKERLLLFGLEYKFIALHLSGELNYNDMFQKLNSAIHAFSKRQMTWFRKMEKEGVNIHWIDSPDTTKASVIIKENYFTDDLT